MKTLMTAALLLSAASFATLALAGPMKPDAKPPEAMMPPAASSSLDTVAPDARSLASDQEVGQARRAYRAACSQHESAGFCDCLTAGVAQALMPSEVRIAARTIGQRINAQGDAYGAESSDSTVGAQSSAERIAQVEAHYADACQQFRN